ncbi:MAG TPA: non-homologous end-joining DNA ligase [Thermoleophilaceae bacterium]|nr:non-homologous end-joining DNA ligase [Thermoleophilaceae bacterium]
MAKQLDTYKRKRNFGATPEPAGGEGAEPEGGRYVVQEHHARRLHWDLRLEHEGALASWAVPNGIPQQPDENRKAVRTEDHPLEYLDVHGEIPAGQYGAGTMTIWDRGSYECHKWEQRKVVVSFHGERLEGRYALFATGDGKDWLIHRMDPPADPAREPLPEHVVPMMAKPGAMPTDDECWAFEVKWDGVRAIAYLEPGRLRLESRNLNDITAQYPELRGLTRALGAREAVLDGEIVALDDEGRPSFKLLQQRMHQSSEAVIKRRMQSHPVSYVIFDLLHLEGHSLLDEPLSERRRRLDELQLAGDHWRTPTAAVGGGEALLEATRSQGLEGLVAKRLTSRYEPGRRSGHWLKVKNVRSQEFVIGGWVPGEGRRKHRIGALLVGVYEDGELRFAGKVGTGFTDATLRMLAERLAPLERATSPFSVKRPAKGAVFAEPELVAELEFTEWTGELLLRHPSFKGLRDDKDPRAVTLEEHPPPAAIPEAGRAELELEGVKLKLGSLDKVLYPASGFTKAQAIDYYLRAAPFLLPHLHGRPLLRGRRSQLVVDDLPALLDAVNKDIELSTTLSLAAERDRPTALALELRPGPGAGPSDTPQVALWIRGMLDQLELTSQAKTAKPQELHVHVPLNSGASFQQTASFAHGVARALEQQIAKALGAGAVEVDWSANAPGKTLLCVYSLCDGERPTVSTPLGWQELERAMNEGVPSFGVEEALDRLEEHGDLFAPVLSERQELPDL